MAIGIVAGTQGGEIELLDEGSAPSVLILQQSVGAPPSKGAIVPLSGEPAPEGSAPTAGAQIGEQPPDRIWVTLGVRTPFRLRLDTSALPAGPLVVDEARFVDRALQETDPSDRLAGRHAEITPENAREWGLDLGAEARGDERRT